MTEQWLFASEPIENIFYLGATIYETPNNRFIINPPAYWGMDFSIEICELLLLFNIISL